VKTNSAIAVHDPINRNCGLSLTGSSVDFDVDYATKHNLTFVSTEGDVHLKKNLKGYIVSADSAKNLYTYNNVEGVGVRLHAKNTYMNVGGDIGASLFIDVKAGTVKNIQHDSQYISTLPPEIAQHAGNGGTMDADNVFIERKRIFCF